MVLLIVVDIQERWSYSSYSATNYVSKSSITNKQHRPIMHTFFEPVEGGCCGMSEEGHDRLLQGWKRAWEERGWETRILTQKDAEQHIHFNVLTERLTELGISVYNQRCYWRWLAMSVVGGGWMTDYDTFPITLDGESALDIERDLGGGFKSYAMAVPCLIHASQTEWERIYQLMFTLMPRNRGGPRISDMLSLRDVASTFGTDSMTVWDNQLAKHAFTKDTGSNNGQLIMDCETLQQGKAIHLSHKGMHEAYDKQNFPELSGDVPLHDFHDAIERRGEASIIIMESYKMQCLRNHHLRA